jgi:hypothetical protein
VSPRDEAGQHQPAAEVDLFALAVEMWRDRGDAAGFDADVDGRRGGLCEGAAKDQVEGCLRAHR